jgi:hypothetical protein
VSNKLKPNLLIITTLSILGVLFLASSIDVNSGTYSFADSSPPALNLSIPSGWITNAGPQTWTMSDGVLVAASDTATSILAGATWSSMNFSMTAYVNGLNSWGTFRMHLNGTTAAGESIVVRIHTIINGSIPAVCFPSYSITGTCARHDTSEIPAYFVAYGYYRVHMGSYISTMHPIALVIEDAALNPFGGPIVISSLDGALVVVAGYMHASTYWQDVQTEGMLSGSLGSTSVSGAFVQTTHSDEDYVTGTAQDYGQISLVKMNPSWLDSNGQFYGNSSIPTTGTINCSPPGLPGTCTETGYASTGHYSIDPKGAVISGDYSVMWPAPSIVFGGNITGRVS